MPDHAHEPQVALAHGGRDPRDLGVVLEEAPQRRGLLADLRQEARAGCAGRLSRRHASRRRRSCCTTSSASSRTTTSARPPTSSRPSRGSPSTRAGTAVAASSAPLERHVDLDEVAHRLDHRERAAREHAVLAADDVVGDDDLGLAERVRAVAEPRTRDRVGDECEPAGGEAPEEADDLGIEVDAVDDRLDDDVGAHQRGADDSRVAVTERPHRVEDVGDRAHAAVERRVGLGRRRVAVPERDRDAARVEQVDQLERARELGRERHQPHGTCREQALEQRRIGVAPRRQAVRAEAPRGEERALEVDAEDAWAGSRCGDRRAAPRPGRPPRS